PELRRPPAGLEGEGIGRIASDKCGVSVSRRYGRMSHAVSFAKGCCNLHPASVAALGGGLHLGFHHATTSSLCRACLARCIGVMRVPRLRVSIQASTSTRFQRTMRAPNWYGCGKPAFLMAA